MDVKGEVAVDSTPLSPAVSLPPHADFPAESHRLTASLERLDALWKRIQEQSPSGISFVDLVSGLLDTLSVLVPVATAVVVRLDGEGGVAALDHCRPEDAREAWLTEVQRLLKGGQLAQVRQLGQAPLCLPYEGRLYQERIQALVIAPLTFFQGTWWVAVFGARQTELSALHTRLLSLLTRQVAFVLECTLRERALEHEKASLEEVTRQKTSEIERITHSILQLNRELEVELRKALDVNDRLSLADRIRESLLATVSHELRTPLSAILGSLELFREEWNDHLPPEARRMIEICERNSSSLLTLISDLLDVASLRRSPPVLLKHSICVAALVQETFERIAPLARANGVRLENVVPREIEAYADSLRIQQVLLHLSGNAIKFRGKEDPYVQMRASIEGECVIIAVKDNGIGIPSENLAHIFEPFVQGEDSYTSPTQGAGLGLSICKGVVEQHGGSIHVESELGKGSCFSFSLPLPPPVFPR